MSSFVMKDIITKLYSAFSKILPLRSIENKANHLENFPVVGFLSDDKKAALEKILKLSIKRVEFFEQALTHRSYLNILGVDKGYQSNERLEFLGDALLSMYITDFLFKTNPGYSEGDLTKIRSRLVNKNSLSYCGHYLGIEDFIMLSFSAQRAMNDGSDSIIADTMEAIIAAIYLDSDFETSRNFVIDCLVPILLDSNMIEDSNFKSLLLEKVQSMGKHSPRYQVLHEAGPDHCKEFSIGVYLDDMLLGTGAGKNKKAAEQAAAKNAIEMNSFINLEESSNGNVNN